MFAENALPLAICVASVAFQALQHSNMPALRGSDSDGNGLGLPIADNGEASALSGQRVLFKVG
jgi:hypothetical protein